MYNVSEVCLRFCMDFDIMNDLVLWLMYANAVLSSSLHARGSFFNYQVIFPILFIADILTIG